MLGRCHVAFWICGGVALALAAQAILPRAVSCYNRIDQWISFFARNPEYLIALWRSAAYVFLVREQPNEAYQAFLDRYAVHEYSHDSITYWKFGDDEKSRPLPELLARFDWFTQESCPGCPFGDGKLAEIRKVDDPSTVHFTFYDMTSLHWLLDAAERWSSDRSNRTLVLASGDELLSGMASKSLGNVSSTVRRLRRHFDRIWIRAKDMEVAGVTAMPALLGEEYLRGGVAATAAQAIAAASVAEVSKPHRVLAAWSFHFKHLNDEVVPFKRGGLRADAVRWAASAAAKRLGVVTKVVPKLEWWSELAQYRFLLVPPGKGVQSHKAFEALLVLTVPIVQRVRGRAIDDLIDLGFPMVAIDSWDEITSEKLEEWWTALAPRLVSFRENCFHTEAMWRLVTGQIDKCT